MLFLGACTHGDQQAGQGPNADAGVDAVPRNYKPEILAAMRAYLNDPTGIRDAGISNPMPKTVGDATRYVVCLRFNPKKAGNVYAGLTQIAAIFVAGRFDRFIETTSELCAGASYAPFPELGKLSR